MEDFSQVKMIFGDEDSKNPRCPHGPCLLMERQEKRFYACSAYRFVTILLLIHLLHRYLV